jgi:hypothetical protein
MGKISSHLATLALLTGLSSGAITSAQTIQMTPMDPENVDADSKAAMSDTVDDPRIVQSQAGENGIWKWSCRQRR